MFRLLPPFGGDQRAVAEIVNSIMNGKTNNTGSVTLATGSATSTTITDARIGVGSVILLSPTYDIGTENPYISSITNGSAVISHPANVTASKTFKYVVVG